MKRILFILPLLSLLVISCTREPFADATADHNPAYVGDVIRFTSYSTNAEAIEWDMDDGTIYNTAIVDHYYIDPGLYNVTLSAFGHKGKISTAVIPMEVIGATLTVEVRLWTDVENGEPYGYLVPNASVRLYPTLTDWNRETNLVAEGLTNSVGRVTFDNLSYQEYYVDIWEANHDNWTLASEDVGWITTPFMDNDYIWIAMVDYYPGVKKSAVTGERPQKTVKSPADGNHRTPIDLATKVPRERK